MVPGFNNQLMYKLRRVQGFQMGTIYPHDWFCDIGCAIIGGKCRYDLTNMSGAVLNILVQTEEILQLILDRSSESNI